MRTIHGYAIPIKGIDQPVMQRTNANIPNCMQLISHLNCSGLLLNKPPNSLQLLTCTSFKSLRVMEDKVPSRVCHLVLNVMYASLTNMLSRETSIFHHLTHLN